MKHKEIRENEMKKKEVPTLHASPLHTWDLVPCVHILSPKLIRMRCATRPWDSWQTGGRRMVRSCIQSKSAPSGKPHPSGQHPQRQQSGDR